MQEFNYERAAMVLAHGKFFKKANACNYFDVPSGTYDGWKNKLKTDDKLQELYEATLKEMRDQWRNESVGALKNALGSISNAFEHDIFDQKPKNYKDKLAWAQGVNACANAIKSIGELTIGTVVLMEDDGDDDD